MQKNYVSPPPTNRGAQNTYLTGLRSCVDWVQVTFKNVQDVHKIIQLLGIKKEQFQQIKTGKYGYKCQMRFGHIAIYYDGSEEMGVHLEMSGQGCREYETLDIFNWSRLFALFHLYDFKFTRLDLAIDDFQGYFTISQLKRKIRDGAVRSVFKTARDMRKTDLSNGKSLGDTVYFGSPQSQIQIRFYDKYLERQGKGVELEKDLEFWNRSELQLRDERANAAATLITYEEYEIGYIVKGILKRYVTFCDKSSDKNKSRWNVSKFWDKFLNDVEKLKLTQVAPDRTIEKVESWIDRQVIANNSMLYLAYEQDLKMMLEQINQGLDKIKEKHIDMLNKYLVKNNKQVIDKRKYKQVIESKKIDIQLLLEKLNA